MGRVFLLAGGGTAGHVNPLLATAAELQERGHRVVALGTVEGLEAELVPRAGLELRVAPRVPFPRRPGVQALAFPARWRRARAAVDRVMDEVMPDAVVGFGGYVSIPAYLAARKRGVPYVVHEANARPGLANRWGARHAAAVAVNFPGTPLPRARVVGLPLRPEVGSLAATLRDPRDGPRARASARRALGWPEDAVGALVMGGSLGAARINAAMTGAIESVAGHGLYVLHLTGRGKQEAAQAARQALPARMRRYYTVREYEHDMATAFAAVGAVVCRAGAVTVAEVSALGLPALYVPLPHGNGEQALNAAVAVQAGAAHMVMDADLSASSLTLDLERMLLDRGLREGMEQAADRIGVVDGAARLADIAEEVSA